MSLRSILILGWVVVCAVPAQAARYVYRPASDQDDGQLVDGSTWDYRPSDAAVPGLLLQLGQEGGSTFDNALGFPAPELSEGQVVPDARIRVGEQGGLITSGLTIQISAALDLDPLGTAGAARFALPRTAANVIWSIPASFDSSGQRIAKWAETPNLAPVVNEVLAQSGWDGGSHDILLFLEVSSASGDNVVRYDDTHGKYWNGGNAGMEPALFIVNETYRDCFWGQELLCRPTPTSMTVNIVPHDLTEAYVEWGTDGVTFPGTTPVAFITGGMQKNFLLSGLTADTQYWYRLQARPLGGTYAPGPTRTFVTLPDDPATEGRVVATTDIHVTNQLALALDTQMDLLDSTLVSMPDFLAPDRYHVWLDLGDLVVVRAQRIAFDQEEVEQRYRTCREYIQKAAHSLPFVLVRGNHEEVNGWDDDATPNNTAVWSGKMLLKYFPPPLPDTFYSGNPTPHPVMGLPGDFFAFNVGALRVRCLDPFLFTETRPHNGHGETGGSLNGWDWKLGQAQYDWLYDDFVQEPATFSLVALHHLTSCYNLPGYYYGRGGIEVVDYAVDGRPSFEWGGQDTTGANALATQRPGFTHGSVHDMIVGQGNQVVMKGHDHFHARQELDGMVYLSMAKPDDTGQHTGDLWGWRWDSYYPETETLLNENSGFYSIVVTDSAATYSYVQTYPLPGAGQVVDSFTILPNTATDVSLPPAPVNVTAIRSVSPNPARIPPRIEYELARSGRVELGIHDVTGRRIADLVSEAQPAGLHEARWDGRDRNGRRVAAGVYFAQLRTEGKLHSAKLVVLR